MPSPIIDDLADMFPDVVVITRQTFDGFGEPTSTTIINAGAQVYGKLQAVATQGGVVLNSTVVAVLKGVFNATTKDKYTLPARFNPREPKALSVAQHTDENGAHHETVYF